MIKTHEGAIQFEHTLDHGLEFFSKAGSVREGSDGFYDGQESPLSLFQKVWIVDKVTSMQLLFWLRNCRPEPSKEGAGNRSAFRAILIWLATNEPGWVAANMRSIPVYGRWDDLKCLFDTQLGDLAAGLWAESLKKRDFLAAKWADRRMWKVRKHMGMKIGDFRRFLSSCRSEAVERAMCERNWKEIDYSKLPSVAMARYAKAFTRHDPEGFEKFKEAVQSGKAEIKAGTLFPHDCVLTALNGDAQTADLQFEALPNFLLAVDDGERPIVLCDTSGSMDTKISKGSSLRAIHVSTALALYCSDRMPGRFRKKFIGFCSEGKFVDWSDYAFSQALGKRDVFDRAVGSTHIDRALDLILNTAKFFNLSQNEMPTSLLIVSDMQFHHGVANTEDGTPVNLCMEAWERAGYKRPKIIYWNLAGYAGSPETVKSENTALVSGFSPSTLRAVFAGEDFTPLGVMKRAISGYEIIRPID